MLAPQQGHIDVGLTNVLVMYRNQNMVGELLFPAMPTEKQSGKVWGYGLDNLRPTNDLRAPASLSRQAEMTLNDGISYYCDGHAQHDWVPDETESGIDEPMDPQVDMTIGLADILALNQEIATINALTAALTPVDLSASAYANAWDTTTIDPITQIDIAKETVLGACGQLPNTLLMSRPVWRGTRNNPTVKSRVSGALEGIDKTRITPAQFAATCEVDNVIIGSAVKINSKIGQPVTSTPVWGKYAVLAYVPPSPGLRTVSLGYTMRWLKGKLAAEVFTRYDQDRHATRVEAQKYYAPTVIVPGAAVMWSNTTQN